MRLLLLLTACFGLATALLAKTEALISDATIVSGAPPSQLSAFGFFDGSAHRPNGKLISYGLANPLFSDYSEKQRFIYVPATSRLSVDPDGKVKFPVGSALIKSFGYRGESGKLNILETRLLLKRADGWIALPYVWRADGSEADLKIGGKRIPVSFTTPRGQKLDISYSVPNKNQCKQCHSSNNALEPIGPVWPDLQFRDENAKKALAARTSFPRNGLYARPDWTDTSLPIQKRAESYLYANCAHCHSRDGAASNSGLYYDEELIDHPNSGYEKRPVAAGQGSGGHDFVVAPGDPDRSILTYRMKSLNPGVAMPELGRATVHAEGVELLEEWIRQMPVKKKSP